MSYSIDYNGYGSTTEDWSNITIDSHETEAVYASDGISVEAIRHTIRGTAMLTSTTTAGLATLITDARKQLSKPGKTLLFRIGTQTIASISADGGDEPGYPRCMFEVVRFGGAKTAMIAFSFTWSDWETEPGDTTDYHVSHHEWSQSFTYDTAGMGEWSVDGELRVRANVQASGIGANPIKAGPNPDAYRGLVMPVLPDGYRVDEQSFVVNPEGSRLVYSLRCVEHARALPAPAFAGDGSFTITKDLSQSTLGTKVTEVWLEGNRTSSPHAMLAAAINVIKRTIKFDPPGADRITLLEVREPSLMSRNRIEVRIEAEGLSSTGDLFSGVSIGQRLVETSEAQALAPDAYGSGLVRAARRQMFRQASGYTSATFPKAATESATTDAVAAYVVPDDAIDGVFSSTIPRGDFGDDGQITTEHQEARYTRVLMTERVTQRTNLRRVGTWATDSADRVYQVGKPTVTIETTYIAERQNQAPQIAATRPPSGAIVIEESHTTEVVDKIDANMNLTIRATYRRVLEVVHDDGPQWVTDTATFGGLGHAVRRWQIPGGRLTRPYDPRIETPASYAADTLFDASSTPQFDLGATSTVLLWG